MITEIMNTHNYWSYDWQWSVLDVSI